jgi:putative PIN family toxin of toxin-antitoxin system
LRFVFDNNVLVSALLDPASTPRRAFDRAVDRGTLLISVPVLAELTQVLSRPRFRRYIDEEGVRRFLAAFSARAEWVEIISSLTVCRDPKDNKILDLAVDGRASHIISGDEDLLVLNPFLGVAVIPPAVFLDRVP